MQKRQTSLTVSSPFSLKATALSHGWHECTPMSWTEGGRCFQVIEREKDMTYRVSVTEASNTKVNVKLRITIEGVAVDDRAVARTKKNVGIMLGVGDDLTEFFELCRDHPTLHAIPAIGAGRGLRSVCMAENIIKAICATNVNWTQAVKMINRLGQLGPIVPNFRNLTAWPTPREILRAGEDYLLDICRVGYRAESILTFCRDVCDGRFDPAKLDSMAASRDVSDDDVLERLRTIRGIGPASAHYLLSFLGRHDRLAIDSSTIAHVARVHTNGKKPTLKRIEQIYAKYGKWKNKVWWYEHWLTWGTARQMLRDAGVSTDGRSR